MARPPVVKVEFDVLLTPGEVCSAFRVGESTLRRWEAQGKLDGAVIKTPGGHRRYREPEIRALLTDWHAS